jgi:hypothetical protein
MQTQGDQVKPSKKPSLLCRRGHRKIGRNLIKRIRDGKKILECRICANAGLAARREARKRNKAILELPKDFGKVNIPDGLGKPFVCDPNLSAFSEETKQFFKDENKRNAKLLKGEE